MEGIRFVSELVSETKVNDQIKILDFSVPSEFSFRAGQYVIMAFYKDEKRILRSYSIFSSPNVKGKISVYFKKVDSGYASNALFDMKVGDKIEMKGPLGNFTLKDSSRDVIFISSGTGYAPFRSIIFDLFGKNSKKIILIRGYRKEEEIVNKGELEDIPNLEVYDVLSQPSHENYRFKGHVQDFLKEVIPEGFKGDFYICGLRDMVSSVLEKLKFMGIPYERIFYERYD